MDRGSIEAKKRRSLTKSQYMADPWIGEVLRQKKERPTVYITAVSAGLLWNAQSSMNFP